MRLFTMLAWWIPVAVFLPLCSCDLFGYMEGADFYRFIPEDYSDESVLVNRLEKILNFFYYDAENVNIDGLLGIVMAEAQLNMIVYRVHMKNPFFETVLNLQKKCHSLIKLLKSKVKISSTSYEKIFKSLLSPNLWELERNFINGSLTSFIPYNWTTIPVKTLVRRAFYQGSPNGKESEYCITEILDKRINYNNADIHDCMPSLKCTVIMSQLDKSHGYPLTHKLLYIQLSRILQCRISDQIVNKSITYLCSRILQEFRAIERMRYHSTLVQDLYLEQMVLCGMEGFLEFLTQNSRKNLLIWQSTYGCYGKDVPALSTRWRDKREISYMTYGCESHITGLAAAAIAINLNYISSTNVLESSEEDFGNMLLLSKAEK